MLQGRFNVSFEDIRAMAHSALRHRMILNFEGEAERIQTDSLIDDILAHVPETAEPPKPADLPAAPPPSSAAPEAEAASA